MSKFEPYKDRGGEFRFRLKAGNGQNILASEGYKAKLGCTNGIDSVRSPIWSFFLIFRLYDFKANKLFRFLSNGTKPFNMHNFKSYVGNI